MTRRNSILVAAVLGAATTLAAAKSATPFDRLINQILAQLDQQAESDKRLITQTNQLRKSLQQAEDQRAGNQFGTARTNTMGRDTLVAANEMIADPVRAKLIFDSFLRSTLEHQDKLLQQAIDGPAKSRLTTARLAAQTKARGAVLKDLRRDVETLRKFPTSKERLNFIVENVQIIADAVQQRGAVVASQP